MHNIQPDGNRIKGLYLCHFNSVLLSCHADDAVTHTHLFVYGFSMPLSSTVMEHLHILYIVPGVICWFSSSLCANSFKNAKVDSLLAALPEAKQQCYPHTNVAPDKVRCAINVNPHHFFPPTVSLPSVLPLSQSLTV